MITADTPINEAIQQYPETVRIFNEAGLDTCCGGALPIGEAAKKHNLDVSALLEDLNSVVWGTYGACCRM
jgi:regulator of cell morphogenesis and NO signaling